MILTGPSGSGKTTLLSLSGALRSTEEGSLKVLGHELNGASQSTQRLVRRNSGFIFQAHDLIDSLTATQNVQMALQLESGLSGRALRRACVKALEAVGLGDRIAYRTRQLSGGQKQRVAIAAHSFAIPRSSWRRRTHRRSRQSLWPRGRRDPAHSCQ